MGDRVAVLTPEGQFGTVDAADVGSLPEGARVLTKSEQKERALNEQYDKASTLQKIGGAVSPLVGPIVSSALSGAGVTAVRPEVQAFESGESSGLTLGADEAAVHELVRQTAGQEAADAYAQRVLGAKEAAPGYNAAGTVVGALAASAAPGVGAAGAAVERGAASLLAPLAARGVLGRAAATGTGMALRGALEGGIIGAAQHTTDELVADHELAGEKLWAATTSGALGGALIGGGLGTAGSLAASGGRAASGAAMRALARGEEAASAGKQLAADVGAKADVAAQEAKALGADVVDAAKAKAQDVASGASSTVGKAVDATNEAVQKGASSDVTKSVLDAVRGKATDESVLKAAYERAWRATGGRKAFAGEANKYLPNGVEDVGEVLMRRGVIDTTGKVADAIMQGTPEAIAERIQGPMATVGQRLGEIVDTSGARIPAAHIDAALAEVIQPLLKSAATEPAGQALLQYTGRLAKTLGITTLEDTVPVTDLLRERKALDRLVFGNTSLDPAFTTQIKRELRSKLEGVIEQAIDGASGKVPGETLAEYKALKHDYQALRIAQDAAEDAATRGVANRTFSLTDKIVGSAAGAAASVIGGPMGGLIAGPAASFVSKIVRERGDAAAAILMKRAADAGLVSKAMRHVDDAIARASTGALSLPKPQLLPESGKKIPIMQRAQQVIQRVAAAQAQPEMHIQRLMQQTEPLAASAPGVANAYVSAASRAAAFLASKLPVTAQPDPLAPNQKPSLTPEDAHKLVRYADYVDRPMRFFEEAAHGKLTTEGAEVAQALMPRAFAELQAATATALAENLARGVRIPDIQRQKLGLILGFPATPAQRPEMVAMLQLNVQGIGGPGNMPSAAPALPKRPASVPTQQSPFDRLEAR